MQGHGARKFVASTLLASSARRNWPLLEVEMRRHAAGPIAPFVSESTELTLILRAEQPATVLRAANGLRQSAPALPGSTFVVPVATREDATFLTGDIQSVMHLYLSDELFAEVALEDHLPRFDPLNVRYVSGVRDPSLNWLARRVADELDCETSAGQALVETLALSLAERMVLNYTDCVSNRGPERVTVAGLDATRLRRVVEYVDANLQRTITVRDMAAVACLSPFHFARAFRVATGRAPHHYISEQRLTLARRLLLRGDQSIAAIAEACSFSSPASFTRAFSAATGRSPGVYRRAEGARSIF